MNHIHRLQADLVESQRQLRSIGDEITRFQALLHGPKFSGTEQDGSRKDWIATGDVLNWLREVRRETVI